MVRFHEVRKNDSYWDGRVLLPPIPYPARPVQGLCCIGDCSIPGFREARGLPWSTEDWAPSWFIDSILLSNTNPLANIDSFYRGSLKGLGNEVWCEVPLLPQRCYPLRRTTFSAQSAHSIWCMGCHVARNLRLNFPAFCSSILEMK